MADEREKKIYKVTIVGTIVNFLLLVLKFIAGVIGHSSAMIADAVHSLSDFITDIIVIVFVKISGRPEDQDHSYGHGKYETLASVIIGIFLLAAGVGIGYNGIQKCILFFRGIPLESPTMLALWAALISLLFKEGLYRYTIYWGRKLNSSVVVANAWHHRSDAYTSVAAFIGIGGAILLGSRWSVLDPLAAAVVSIFILKSGYDLIKPGIDELMEKSLDDSQIQRISEIITATPGVAGFHRLQTRKIGANSAIDVHVKMPGDFTLRKAHDVASVIEKNIKAEFGEKTHVGIHMEPKK